MLHRTGQFAQFVFGLAALGHFVLQLGVDVLDFGHLFVHHLIQLRAVLFQGFNQARILNGHRGLRGEHLQRGHIVCRRKVRRSVYFLLPARRCGAADIAGARPPAIGP